ncbi:hypothetical protein [Streptomyces sp. NPDC020917]|uniref:hypothetical protein n=1 Tax=Streptomyces sp. NPDC020917 TaxID=3365102 RepID=UPI00379B44AE
MKKNRIVVATVLTAGLGLTGVVAASASGAATPGSAAPAKAATAQVLGHKGTPGRAPVVVCAFVKAPKGGKPGQGLPVPKPGHRPEKITIKVVGGKVYVNGKPVPGAKVGKDCPEPPALPPLPGGKTAGGTIVQGAPGGREAGFTTSTSTLAG